MVLEILVSFVTFSLGEEQLARIIVRSSIGIRVFFNFKSSFYVCGFGFLFEFSIGLVCGVVGDSEEIGGFWCLCCGIVNGGIKINPNLVESGSGWKMSKDFKSQFSFIISY